MQKLSEEEYLKKALRLWGIDEDYIDARIRTKTGINQIIELYKCYDSGVKNELIFNDEGRIDLDKIKFEKSMIEVNNSSKAYGWIIFSDLSTGILKTSLECMERDEEAGIKARYATLMSMTVARKLGIEAAQYYLTTNRAEADVKNELGYIYTPNFVKENEELISGLDIDKDINVRMELRGCTNNIDMKHIEKALEIYLKNRKFRGERNKFCKDWINKTMYYQ